MKKREMTVYKSRGNNREACNPLIMLQGKWLKDVGFSMGDKISVTCREEMLVIEKDGSWK